MAEGYLRRFVGDRAEVFSAGVEAHGLNPHAVAVMAADGVDISNHRSKTVDELNDHPFDYVITVCDHARERCPYFPGGRLLHHNFPDPARATGTPEEVRRAFIEVRDQIREYARDFVKTYLT